MSKIKLLVTMVSFWVILGILGGLFSQTLLTGDVYESKPDDQYHDDESATTLIGGFADKLEDIQIVRAFVPLFKIMTFQYSDQIPWALVIILDAFAIFTGYLFLELILMRV